MPRGIVRRDPPFAELKQTLFKSNCQRHIGKTQKFPAIAGWLGLTTINRPGCMALTTLMDGTAPALPRDAEHEIVIWPGARIYLKIEIGFIRQSCLELPVVCARKCQQRPIFTTLPLIMIERPYIVITLYYTWLRYVIVTLCGDIWASSFHYVLPILSFKQRHALKATRPCVFLVIFTKLRNGQYTATVNLYNNNF